MCGRRILKALIRVRWTPPNGDVHRCPVIHVRNMANLGDTLGRQPFVDLFLYLNLSALKYRHLHRWNDSGARSVSQPQSQVL